MMRTLITLFCTLCSIQAALAAPRQASCGTGDHLLTDNNGVIKSHAGIDQNHTYGRNLDCIWKIQAPVGMRVELFAKSFDLEDDATCDHDYLLLYDGETSTSLGKFCGRYFKPTLSSGRYMVLQLITNSIIQAGGFSIFYNFTTSNHPHVMCAIDQFECSHGGCIPSAYKCDNADDCGDDSDEQNCDGIALTTCATNHFDCHNPMGCIPVHWVCDGDDDCGNNLDENQEACYELSSHIANS